MTNAEVVWEATGKLRQLTCRHEVKEGNAST